MWRGADSRACDVKGRASVWSVFKRRSGGSRGIFCYGMHARGMVWTPLSLVRPVLCGQGIRGRRYVGLDTRAWWAVLGSNQ